MELVDTGHHEYFLSMDLGSSTHSESSDDLLVWCNADEVESDSDSRELSFDVDSVYPTPPSANRSNHFHTNPNASRAPQVAHRAQGVASSDIHSSNLVDYIEPDMYQRPNVQMDMDASVERTDNLRDTAVATASITPNSASLGPLGTEDFSCAVTQEYFSERKAENKMTLHSGADANGNGIMRSGHSSALSNQSTSNAADIRQVRFSIDADLYSPVSQDFVASPSVDLLPNRNSQMSSTSSRSSSSLGSVTETTDRPLMLCPMMELAHGDTLTCMLVNILRCLRLLDRCGLEDLCASLCDLHSIEQSLLDHDHSHDCYAPHDVRNGSSESPVTRSSSFTSPSLVSPTRTFASAHRRAFAVKCSQQAHSSGCCLVDYILKCSARGSAVPIHSASLSLQQVDWRRGRATNMVTLFADGRSRDQQSNVSHTTITRLLTGRFLPGPNTWRSVWPWTNYHPTTKSSTLAGELSYWLLAWMKHGAAIVLAELLDPVESSDTWRPHLADLVGARSELRWRHRLIYGLTEDNHVFLSNPEEVISIADVLSKLSHQTSLKLEKSELIQLWMEHERNHSHIAIQDVCNDVHRSSHCMGDFSALARQPDPRWNQINVLGQVLQTIRGMDNRSKINGSTSSSSTAVHLEQSCLSPFIHIPSLQSPGFSVFVARANWELCHALHGSSRLFE